MNRLLLFAGGLLGLAIAGCAPDVPAEPYDAGIPDYGGPFAVWVEPPEDWTLDVTITQLYLPIEHTLKRADLEVEHLPGRYAIRQMITVEQRHAERIRTPVRRYLNDHCWIERGEAPVQAVGAVEQPLPTAGQIFVGSADRNLLSLYPDAQGRYAPLVHWSADDEWLPDRILAVRALGDRLPPFLYEHELPLPSAPGALQFEPRTPDPNGIASDLPLTVEWPAIGDKLTQVVGVANDADLDGRPDTGLWGACEFSAEDGAGLLPIALLTAVRGKRPAPRSYLFSYRTVVEELATDRRGNAVRIRIGNGAARAVALR